MNDRHRQDVESKLDDLMRDIRDVQALNEEDHAALRQIAQRLMVVDLSSRSRIKEQLYQQLKHTSSTYTAHTTGDNNTMMNFSLKRSAAAVAVLIALLASVPALTVLAQTILGQIGPVTVTNEQENLPTGESVTVDQMEATPTPIPVDVQDAVQTAPITNPDGAVATNLSTEAAAAIAGFDIVREPSDLPAGYEFGGRIVFGGASTTINSLWHRPGSFDEPLARMSISQSTGEVERTYRVGPEAQSAEVAIGDIPATLITGADLGSSDGQLVNILLWEEGGYLYVMTSPSLSEDDMLAVAESMYR